MGIFRTSSLGDSLSSNPEAVGVGEESGYPKFATKGRYSEHQKIIVNYGKPDISS